MIKLLTFIAASIFTFASWHTYAEPVDSGPPAQMQKDNVPQSTATGNYLEPQPDENGVVKNSTLNKKMKKAKVSKPTNLEKGKQVTQEPEGGGMELK